MQQEYPKSTSPAPEHFQYPRSDRRRCNNLHFAVLAPSVSKLSVSSVGSEAMQLCSGGSDLQRMGLPFSILGRIGGDATMAYWLPTGAGEPFSILGRIGGDATTTTATYPDCGIQSFQYPRSDRRRCNKPWLSRCTHCLDSLSVSSVGSEAMQPSGQSLAPCSQKTLSVSSVGSEAMQQLSRRWNHLFPRSFQYPRSDRRRCNCATPADIGNQMVLPFSILGRIGGDATRYLDRVHISILVLSVSSVGSEAMQQALSKLVESGKVPFSILGRIGGDATPFQSPAGPGSLAAFSILGRIGGDATSSVSCSRRSRSASFSILGRIGGDATPGKRMHRANF